jgi:hypothetical protein
MNKYEVLGIVGEGAYGVVLKCRNRVSHVSCGSYCKSSSRQTKFTYPSVSFPGTHFDVACSVQMNGEVLAIKKFKESDGRCKEFVTPSLSAIANGDVWKALFHHPVVVQGSH